MHQALISFRLDGTAAALHDEEVDEMMCSIAEKTGTRRWSNVEWNSQARKWQVIKDHVVLFSHEKRSECIKWEVAEYERRERCSQ